MKFTTNKQCNTLNTPLPFIHFIYSNTRFSKESHLQTPRKPPMEKKFVCIIPLWSPNFVPFNRFSKGFNDFPRGRRLQAPFSNLFENLIVTSSRRQKYGGIPLHFAFKMRTIANIQIFWIKKTPKNMPRTIFSDCLARPPVNAYGHTPILTEPSSN